MKLIPLSCGLLVFWGIQCHCADSVYDLTIEQLAQIEVSISSKIDLPLNLSPAAVSILNHQQLFQYGVHQLADLADINPGYASYSIFGERVLETRGQKAGSFENNKHLILLDGIRLNHTRANKAPIENELPLWTLNKLEILRGPASALYGQSAFYGVISLNSAFTDQNDFSGEINYRPEYNDFRVSLKGNLQSDLGHSYLAYSRFDKDSSDALVGPDFTPLQLYYDDQKAEFIYARQHYETKELGSLRLGYIELNRQSGLGEHWNGDFSDPGNSIQWTTQIGYLQWKKKINQNWKSSIKLVINDSLEQGTATSNSRSQVIAGDPIVFDLYLVDVRSKLVEGELNWQIAEQQSVIMGASVEQRQDLGGFFASNIDIRAPADINQTIVSSEQSKRQESDNILYQGLYIQYYDFLSDWADVHLTAGVRYDKGKYLNDEFSQWSPRLALVKQIDKQWTVKGSYSAALRSPGLKEYLLNDETQAFILNNALDVESSQSKIADSLRAETFKSFELSALYKQASYMVKFNTFYNQTQNSLDGSPISFIDSQGDLVSKNSFANSSQNFVVYGGEVELDWRLSPSWHFTGFISQALPKHNSRGTTSDIAKFKTNLSVTGKFTGFTVNFMQRYHSDISGSVSHISKFDATVSNQTAGFNWYLKASNMFNHQNYYSINGEIGNPLPDRSFELGVSYKFH